MNIIKIVLSIITLTFCVNANKISNLEFNIKVNGKIKKMIISNVKFKEGDKTLNKKYPIIDEDTIYEKIANICDLNSLTGNQNKVYEDTPKEQKCVDTGMDAYDKKFLVVQKQLAEKLRKDNEKLDAEAERLDAEIDRLRKDTANNYKTATKLDAEAERLRKDTAKNYKTATKLDKEATKLDKTADDIDYISAKLKKI